MALEMIANLPEEDRKDMTGRALAVIRLLGEQGVDEDIEAGSDLLMGVQFRLEALARLHDEPAYRAWSMNSGTPGMNYIHDDLVVAAAMEPLKYSKRAVRFAWARMSE